MRKTILALSLVLCFTTLESLAQTTLPVPLNIEQAIRKGSRTNEGVPGKNYWQNGADYVIRVNYAPDTRLLSGTETIVYYNHSPDTLKQLLFKLYPNFYQKGAARADAVKAADLMEGVSLSNLTINQLPHAVQNIPEGTNWRVPITRLLPGDSLKVSLDFSYTLNMGSHQRTGAIDSSAFFIAYFFPRIAVYDDLDGWNLFPYNGSQEFYNDFCHFAVDITVPKNYLVWATGDLKNGAALLGQKYIDRITKAEHSDAITQIIDSNDLAAKDIANQNALNTWTFDATHVTDFVFALSNHYLWYASSVEVDKNSKRRTRVDVAFNPRHKDFYEVIDFARKTVDLMSYQYPKWPFPYPHETVFDGLDQMEYPMMVNDNPLQERTSTISLTDHEIFHTMFPFYMGVNETKYAWMDEGWATVGEWLLSPKIDTAFKDGYGMEAYNRVAGKELDLPIINLSTELTGTSYFLNSYPKPALGYMYVQDMLGETAFFQGLHYYISHWNGKHPMPLDFFNSMNVGSGRNMNWFWKRWFYDGGYPDLSIASANSAGIDYQVTIENIGGKPVPVDLTIYFADGSVQKIHRDVSCWEQNNKTVELHFTSSKKPTRLTLGSLYVPDVNKKDNEYIWGAH
jgi:hypothetical protein